MAPTILLRPALLLAFAACAAAACGGRAPAPSQDAPAQTPVQPADPVAAVQAWREKHEADYRYEWASISGLHALVPGSHAVGSDPGGDIVIPHLPPRIGRIVVGDGQVVRFEPEPDVVIVKKGARTRAQPGQPPDELLAAPIVMYEPGIESAPEVAVGSVRLVIHTGGGQLALRARDPQSEQARTFLGFSWFPIDSSYRVTGRFIPDAEPRDVQVLNTYGDIDTYRTDGVVEFELGGRTVRLRPFTTRPRRFYFVFRDATSGQETYETARFLYSDLLEDGTSVLDFNEAYNPPCAFNPYTTCPIPLRENILPVRILAGEKAYPIEVKTPAGR
jgi:uncharacterized protein (DUF1684 family)